MYRVAVLMSTYNGEKYIKEQLDSILFQEGVEIKLFIRDDGSTDRTIEIINEYKSNYNNIIFSCGENLGLGSSFMQLVYDVCKLGDTEFDFYAFSDQDDIWLKDKMLRAVEILKKLNQKPSLYCTNLILVDKQGRQIGYRCLEKYTDYMQILCNNYLTGCAMVWNEALQTLISDTKRRPSKEVLQTRFHDLWIAIVAAVTGKIYLDKNSYILYRQHENNVVGVKRKNILLEWWKKILNPNLRNGRSKLAKEIVDKFGDKIEDVQILNKLKLCSEYKKTLKNKLSLCKSAEIRSCTRESVFGYVLKILFNLF